MKQLYLTAGKVLIAFLLLVNTNIAKSQFVTIPDTVFASWLNFYYPGAMVGQQLDTTNSPILSTTYLSVSQLNIHDLTGVQYFKNITTLDCSSDSLTFIPTLPAHVKTFDCSDNQLTALPGMPDSLTSLTCYLNPLHGGLPSVLPSQLNFLTCYLDSLSSLPDLPPNLIELNCHLNHLTSLPSLPLTLEILYCTWNNNIGALPPLPQGLMELQCGMTGISVLPVLPSSLNYLDCSNSYDFLGCGVNNQITHLPALPTALRILACSELNLDSLPNPLPPTLWQLFCSHDNLNHLPLLPSTITYFWCDSNNLTSIPPLPDSLIYFDCSYNTQLNCLPELKQIGTLNFEGTNVQCLSSYGSVQTSTPSLDSLPLCGIINNAGCITYYNISGLTYFDRNNNCVFSNTDVGAANAKILLYNNGTLQQQIYTGGNGLYSFNTGYGNYAVQCDTSNLPFIVHCPAAQIINDTITAANALSDSNDFSFICRTNGYDLGINNIIYTHNEFSGSLQVNITAGDIAQLFGGSCASGVSGVVQLQLTGCTFTSPAAGGLTPSSQTDSTVTWNISDFSAINDFSAFNILVLPRQNICCITATIATQAYDYNLANNTLSYCFMPPGGSHDPNEKEVYPTTVDSAGQWLTYTIRCQNNGTAPAYNIVITDTLDSHLDPSTFQLLASSAKNVTQVIGHVAVFSFPNVNLPDSATSDSASRGFVQFRIKTVSNFTANDNVSNKAYIYFDQNPAMVTNTVTDTVTKYPAGIGQLSASTIIIYPDPVTDWLFIKTGNTQPETVSIYNMEGKLISTQAFKTDINVQQLISGVYVIQLENRSEVVRKMFVKVH